MQSCVFMRYNSVMYEYLPPKIILSSYKILTIQMRHTEGENAFFLNSLHCWCCTLVISSQNWLHIVVPESKKCVYRHDRECTYKVFILSYMCTLSSCEESVQLNSLFGTFYLYLGLLSAMYARQSVNLQNLGPPC